MGCPIVFVIPVVDICVLIKRYVGPSVNILEVIFYSRQMNLSNIMSNIYGEASSQSFDGVSLSGGALDSTSSRSIVWNGRRHTARVRYLDEAVNNTINDVDDYPVTEGLGGGAKRYGGSDKKVPDIVAKDTIYLHPLMILNNDVQEYARITYNQYRFAQPHPNGIYVIPSKNVMKEIEKEIADGLKSNNIEPYTTEAYNWIAKKPLLFKHYIVDVYGRDDSTNANFPYKVPTTFPKSGSNEVIRRTSRMNGKYYFQFIARDNIKVSATSDMKKATTLSVIAICDKGVLVISGELPKATEMNRIDVVPLSGGDKRAAMRRTFKELVRNNNESIDEGAYAFIGRVALAEAEALGDASQAAKHMAQYYSGDFVHSAFKVLADNDEFTGDINKEYHPEDIDEMHSMVIDNYRIYKTDFSNDKAKHAIRTVYNNARQQSSASGATNAFVDGLVKMYGKIPHSRAMLKADVATSLVRRSGGDVIDYALDVIDDMGDGKTLPALSGGTLAGINDKHIETRLMTTIYAALDNTPFIGINAISNTPLIMCNRKRRVLSGGRLSIAGGAFEDKTPIEDIKENTVQAFSAVEDVPTPKAAPLIEEPMPEPAKQQEPVVFDAGLDDLSDEPINGGDDNDDESDFAEYY